MKIIYSVILSGILLASLSSTLTTAFAQSPTQGPTPVCADATFTPPLPQPFTNGTWFPFTVDFGTSFSTISEVAAISTYDSADKFGKGDEYFIDNFGGQGTQPGEPEDTTMTLIQVDPTALSQFVNGSYQGKYVDQRGQFTLTSLKFCITGEIKTR